MNALGGQRGCPGPSVWILTECGGVPGGQCFSDAKPAGQGHQAAFGRAASQSVWNSSFVLGILLQRENSRPDKLTVWILVLRCPLSYPCGTGPEPAPPRPAISVHNGFSFVMKKKKKKRKKKKLYIGSHCSVKVLHSPMTIFFLSPQLESQDANTTFMNNNKKRYL